MGQQDNRANDGMNRTNRTNRMNRINSPMFGVGRTNSCARSFSSCWSTTIPGFHGPGQRNRGCGEQKVKTKSENVSFSFYVCLHARRVGNVPSVAGSVFSDFMDDPLGHDPLERRSTSELY